VSTDQSNPPKAKNGKPDRREYRLRYYRENREKLLAYQREYARKYRRKAKFTDGEVQALRQSIRHTYNICDIMKACPEKAARMVDGIIRGERFLTMPHMPGEGAASVNA